MKKSSIINYGKKVLQTELVGIKKLNQVIDQNFDNQFVLMCEHGSLQQGLYQNV